MVGKPLYISTRGSAAPLNFEETMLAGLAADGGLYVPERWPQLSADEIAALGCLPYEETAFRVMKPYIGDTFDDTEFDTLIRSAYESFDHPARCPLVQLEPWLFLLELFHGPTSAFKDFAMQLVGQMFDALLRRRGERVTIIGATSGDTGSAAIEAFRGSEAVDVFILFPDGRVSDFQRRQMTTAVEPNVHAISVAGDFDDCQALVKGMFNDSEFRRDQRLAGINSINWARILAQIVYYFHSAVALGAPFRKVGFAVPTGNFGDIFAGFAARRMGLPISRLIIATNQNDILHRAISSGDYRKETVQESFSPSMDIQVSSNFERALFEALGRDHRQVVDLMERVVSGGFEIPVDALGYLRSEFESGKCSESETLRTIADTCEKTGKVICPHTAVGVKVARDAGPVEGCPVIAFATAHPAKFPRPVGDACGEHPEVPRGLMDLCERDERVVKVENDLGAVMAAIREGSRI